jgi:cytochrome c2
VTRRRPAIGPALALAWLGLAGAAGAAPAAADAQRGARVFQRCYACHSVVPGEAGLPGPSLRCVLGRRAGTLPDFEFSPAMVDAGRTDGLVWSRATLDAFLADPARMVPGTTMAMPGLPEAQDRRDVIDFLEATAPCPHPPRTSSP